MSNKRFFMILSLEIILISIGIFLYFGINSSDIYKLFAGDTNFYKSPVKCNLHKTPCSVHVGDKGIITFEIEPKDIPLMKTLTFRVNTSKNLSIKKLDLSIYATNMNMGYNTFELKKISDKIYKTKGILPSCVIGNMNWKAELVINDITKSNGAIFTFKTK